VKGLLILLLVLGGVWLWRKRQPPPAKMDTPKTPQAISPQDMVRCGHCGLHLPSVEAIEGKNGVYCSADHQHLAEP